jgi:hypothetical protein
MRAGFLQGTRIVANICGDGTYDVAWIVAHIVTKSEILKNSPPDAIDQLAGGTGSLTRQTGGRFP